LIFEGQDEACHYLANNILYALKEKEARGKNLFWRYLPILH
jgi:hypothetical protein